MHAWWSEYDGMRLVMASIGLSRTQLSTSGLQVGDLKASVTPSLHRCCVDVSVSCSCAHLQGQHDARSRPLLLRSLGPKVSEGTRHHRHALDGLPRRKPCTTAVWDESVSFPRLTTTYVWTSPRISYNASRSLLSLLSLIDLSLIYKRYSCNVMVIQLYSRVSLSDRSLMPYRP